MISASIIGASGYSGAELLRLLSTRDDVRLTHLSAAKAAGMRVAELYPSLAGRVDGSFESYDPSRLDGTDVAFIALPSGEAMSIVPAIKSKVGKVIDLGGDFRLTDPAEYEKYYRRVHASPALLAESVYGLPEANADRIRDARLIANPGCYPTGAILALLPAVAHGLIAATGIVVNSLSGVSGAGRSSSVDLSFSEVNENIRAYKIGTHQHIPEIHSAIERITGKSVSLSFVPHLVPITRGIYTTIHANLAAPAALADIRAAYAGYYGNAPFVRIKDDVPQIAAVTRTNFCDIGLAIEPRTQQLIITSVIDNLVKGAAGQAIQNMNIMFNLPQERGLQ